MEESKNQAIRRTDSLPETIEIVDGMHGLVFLDLE